MSQSLILQKPDASIKSAFTPQDENIFLLDFSTSDAILSRNGDDLVFSFEDDSSIALTDFYNNYTSENMPSFEIEGAVIDGETFFNALNATDIMPAAGPAASQTPDSGSFVDYNNSNLLDGVDNLGGLSLGNVSASVDLIDTGGIDALSGNATDTVDSTSPDVPPVTPPVTPPTDFEDRITVDEKGLDDATNASETVTWNVPEGFTIVSTSGNALGGIVLNGDGSFTYTLNDNITHTSDTNGSGAETITVTLKDANGNQHEVEIKVDITDDVPTIEGSDEVNIETAQEFIGPINFETEYKEADGTIIKNDNGTTKDFETDVMTTKGGITISSVKVTFDEKGDIISKDTVSDGTLGYRENQIRDDVSHGEGLTVLSNRDGWDAEIKSQEGVSEGVMFELPIGKVAYSLNLNLEAFFEKDGEYENGNNFDTETGIIYFYRGGILVDQMELTSTALGTTAENYVGTLKGFDKVIIVPTHNATNEGSSFLINSIEFNDYKQTFTSQVDFDLGADDGAGSGIVFDYTTDEVIRVNGIDITITNTLNEDGTSTLLGVDSEGENVFNATLNPDGSWSLDLFQKFEDGSDFDLKFTVTDSDGDTVNHTVKVDFRDATSIQGTEGDDKITGTQGSDNIFGNGGDDFIDGGAGDDFIDGGAGNDVIVYDSNDTIDGGEGIDILLVAGDTNVTTNTTGIEAIITGIANGKLTPEFLADHGITVGDDSITLNDTWKQDGTDLDTWTSGDLHLSLTGDVESELSVIINSGG